MDARVRTAVMAYIALLLVSATVLGLFMLPELRSEFSAALLGELGVVTGFFFGQRDGQRQGGV